MGKLHVYGRVSVFWPVLFFFYIPAQQCEEQKFLRLNENLVFSFFHFYYENSLICNMCLVGHEKMLEFICDKTATPYFSNLIWLIGKDAIELDDCVVQESE